MPVLSTEPSVRMTVGRDFTSEHAPPDSAMIDAGETFFRIRDPFAAYLAARNNAEFATYLKGKAEEIRMFLDHMEARVTRK